MNLEICILAGGLGTRLGRDKARLKLGGQTMLARIRRTARALGCPVRVIRRDAVARCGPLGGIITALRSTRAEAVLFLACDMPLVTAALLKRMVRASGRGARAACAVQAGCVGFPLLLPATARPAVEAQWQNGELSLQALARRVDARRVIVSMRRHELVNVNTPGDAALARQRLRASEPLRLSRPTLPPILGR